MKRRLEPIIYSAQIEASCPRCGDVYAVHFDVYSREEITLECAQCSHKTVYFLDQDITVPLKYMSSGQAVGRNCKPRKKTPDVLRGQMSFQGVL